MINRRDGSDDDKIASVVDLFCGVGGLTHGFLKEGFAIAGGIDVDESCRYPYERNNEAPFYKKDVSKLTTSEISKLFVVDKPRVLVGCAPCQPFSTYNQKNNDPKWQLVAKFGSFITRVRPDVVSMENVPRLRFFQDGRVFDRFVSRLEANGYHVWHDVVYTPDFGVPQRRSRLVLLASLHGPISLSPPRRRANSTPTVRKAIGHMPPLPAGGIDEKDPLHRTSTLSATNLARIQASTPGGTWHDWDDHLVTPCHQKETGSGYVSVYGRMEWDEPSPTITTQFYGFGNGRFGHPTQNRAISLREGAMLQSFPRSYRFVEPHEPISFKQLGRHIGNAVPVKLARGIAKAIRRHLESIDG